jgi:hypothetical protein
MSDCNEKDEWSNDLKIITKCEYAPSTFNVTFNRIVKNKIDLLMKRYKNTEWLAYLVGVDGALDINANEPFIIGDILLPEQEVTGTTIHVLKPLHGKKIVGVIHSHHTMGAFFSSTDIEYINSNHKLSIVVSTTGYKAQVRWDSPCGSSVIVPANVGVAEEVLFDVEGFLSHANDQIIEKTITMGVAKTLNELCPVVRPVTTHLKNPKYKKGRYTSDPMKGIHSIDREKKEDEEGDLILRDALGGYRNGELMV